MINAYSNFALLEITLLKITVLVVSKFWNLKRNGKFVMFFNFSCYLQSYTKIEIGVTCNLLEIGRRIFFLWTWKKNVCAYLYYTLVLKVGNVFQHFPTFSFYSIFFQLCSLKMFSWNDSTIVMVMVLSQNGWIFTRIPLR